MIDISILTVTMQWIVQEGHLMVINCVKKSTRKDGRRSDVLSRDSKMSPGKVTKSSPTKLRAKVPSKPISLTIRYSEDLKGKRRILLFHVIRTFIV